MCDGWKIPACKSVMMIRELRVMLPGTSSCSIGGLGLRLSDKDDVGAVVPALARGLVVGAYVDADAEEVVGTEGLPVEAR